MTLDELGSVLKFAKTACGVREVPEELPAVWFELLGDMPADVVRAAVKMVVLKHEFATMPPVGAIRKAAVELQQPSIPAAKAWELFLAAVRKHGSGKRTLYRAGHEPIEIDNTQRGLDSLPPQVRRAAIAFGWQTLCDTAPDELGLAQEQFRKTYNSLGESEQRNAIMPPSVKAIAATIAESAEPTKALAWTPKALEGIKP